MDERLDYYSPDDLDVQVADMLVATSDASDAALHPKVQEVLRLLREKLQMDVVFVSQVAHHGRMFRTMHRAQGSLSPAKGGHSDPLESSWGQQVVQQRMLQSVGDRSAIARGRGTCRQAGTGTYLNMPVRSPTGEALGTLCCFSRQVSPDSKRNDLMRLRHTAKLIAEYLEPAGLVDQHR